MAFINGWLGLCTALGAGTCTEIAAPGYARQPVAFGPPAFGVSRLATNFTFGAVATGTVAGRAVFDAPTGGNLLFTMSFAVPQNPPLNGPCDARTIGEIVLQLAELAPYASADAVTTTLNGASVIGSCYDPPRDRAGWATASNGAPVETWFQGIVTSGVPLVILRGQLMAQAVLHMVAAP